MKSAFKERQLSDYSATSQRPKRNASTKGLGCSNGLHWMEEKQLKKALYASLNETKKARLLDENASEDGREQTPKTTASTVVAKKAADTDSKRIKVHAQRKFAQGSNPSSPMPTPVKILPQCRESRDAVSQPSTLLPCKRRPKTEDFLTFLCLRGTTALPPALDFMSGTAFPGSSSSSDRSSSPEIDATPQSANAECREKGTSAGAHWGTVSADVRNTAQRAAPRGPKQDRRPFRPESVEEKQGSEQRSSRSATAKVIKMDRRKIVPEKPKDTLKPGSISRCHSKPNANLTALQEKYKQRRIAHQSGPSRKQSALGHGGGHALRSRTTHGAVHSGSKRVVKAPCVKSKEQLSNAVPNRHPVAGRDEEMAAKNRLVLKRQLSVQLTRLHPRIAAGLRLPIAASSGTGVVTRRRSVGITPHLRKAKMVPPIVDYESESEKDLFPLSPPRSPLVVQPRPRAAGTKAHNVSQKPKRKVAISTATKKRPTSVIARKLLNRATTRMRPTSAVRKRTRCTVFRRKTRSLGPVKEYPLVLALPTKRGAGRFGTVAKKKAEVLAAKTAKSKTPLTRSSELPQSVFQSKVSQVSSKASSVQAQQTPKKDAVANQNDRTLKRSTRRVSSECASELRCLRQRSDTTTQCKRETRKAFVDAPEKTRKVVTKRRKVEVSADNTSSQLFSDSDDEPLIKMAGRLSERKALSTTEKDSHSKQDKLGPAQKTEVVTAPLTGMLSRKKAASVKDKNKLPEIDKSRFFKNSLVPERFSEPSPSSLSETIADAAGDPLDTRADFDDLESMSGGVEALDALAGEISQVMSCRLSFGSAQEIQSLMTSEFSGAFDENVTGAMLLGTRDGRSTSFEGGLNLLKRDDTPSKIDAATNTSDESITLLATSTPEELVAVSPEEVSVGTQTAVCDTDGLSSAAVIEAVSRTARRLSFTGSETSTVEAQPGLEAHKPVPASPKSKSSALPVQKSASPSNSTMKPDTRAGSVSSESSTRLGGKQAHISTSVHGARFAARKETSETKAASFFGAAKRSSALDKARPLQRHGSLNPTLGLRASVGRVPKSPAKVAPVPKPGPSKRSKTASDEPRRAKLTPLDSKKFPSENDPACLVAAPTYRPTADEMRDPVSYISKIRPEAEKFGICRIILPPSFQPECKVFDDMRFTAYNQYIHKMLSRWGPNVQHTACIKRCFTKQGITDDQPPLIGGIELDLSYLYHTVQNFGGIQQVMEKKKWHRVADAMHIPKAAQDRVSKVDDAYCKFVLPYDLLSADEKKAIEIEVLADRERQMATDSEPSSTSADEDEEEEFSNECVAKVSRHFASRGSHGRMKQPPAWTDQSNTRKGRSMSLSVFSRVARNTMSMWYKHEPSTEEVEKDYWNLVIDQRRHVCVHAGNIDSSVHGSGFPTNRLVPFAKKRKYTTMSRHPWNLKVLTNNPGTVLRCMGPVSGVTIPTLHLSMLYTTGCWYRDPHCLPWIEYLHTGANKIWYSVPAHSSERFRAAMKEMMPQVCKDSAIWLPSDCAMVPPPQLVEHGCPLSRLVQEKGQFVVIFPGAFTSTIACGYSVSESVYFATQDWLLQASECFEHMKASCEPPTFSFEKLLLGIASELRENLETCRWTLPLLQKMCEKEQRYRTQLVEMGLKTFERLPTEDAADPKKSKRPRLRHDNSNHECDFCRVNCHVSMVVNLQDDCLYCLEHAVHCLQRKNMKSWKLLYAYDMDELRSILRKLEEHIESSDASQMKTDSESSSSKKKVAKKK